MYPKGETPYFYLFIFTYNYLDGDHWFLYTGFSGLNGQN